MARCMQGDKSRQSERSVLQAHGSMIKLTINKIPAEATTFKIIASNNIAGICTVDLTAADPILAVTSDESKEITASFTASADIKSRNFYIPLPTGTYSSITAPTDEMEATRYIFTKTLNDKNLREKRHIGSTSFGLRCGRGYNPQCA